MKNGPPLKNIHGQPSWCLRSSRVETYVTQLGGHLGPATFRLGQRSIRPFSVAPWAKEPLPPRTPAILKVLRGDFFCMPFGNNTTPFQGEHHPPHGETANARWKFESLVHQKEGVSLLHLSLRTKIRMGRVEKRIFLYRNHTAIYSEHILSGISGPISFGHHAMLRFPDKLECGVLSTAPFVFGQVLPEVFEFPKKRGYSMLKPGSMFESLQAVETIYDTQTDLSRYPQRRGFEDLVMLCSNPEIEFAWTAVTFHQKGYVWLALKNPKVLPSTLLWISNGGRHYPPWNGRHIHVMGLEEVASYFHFGLAESVAPNPIQNRGIPTYRLLKNPSPFTIRYIMAVGKIPKDFDRVVSVQKTRNGVTLTALSGAEATIDLNLEFLNEISPPFSK